MRKVEYPFKKSFWDSHRASPFEGKDHHPGGSGLGQGRQVEIQKKLTGVAGKTGEVLCIRVNLVCWIEEKGCIICISKII